MSDFANFTQALFGAANTASNIVNDYTTNQAKLSTSNKQIRLQEDINNELENIRRSSNYNDWQKNMNDFFERVKNGMSDKNSQYYCENNLQAEMFSSILEQNQVGISEKVNQMVFSAQRDHALVDYNNNLSLYANEYTGQDYVNKANEGAKLLYDCGYITEEQLQQQYDSNFERGYIDTNSKIYRDSVADAVKNGMSENEFIEAVKAKTEDLMAIDTSGLPKAFDKEAMDQTLEKNGRSDYRAYVQDIQNKNETRLSEIYANVLRCNTAEERNAVRRQGQYELSQMKGLQLDATVRTRYATYFALEDYLTGGTTTEGQAVTSLSKLPAKDQMEFYIGQWKKGSKGEEGGIDNLYNAYNLFKDSVMKQAQEISPDATWTDIERECPVVMEFFEEAKKQFKNIPGMQDILDNAEEMLGVINTDKDNIGMAMDIVQDMLFEVDVSDMDGPTIQNYEKRIAIAFNSLYGRELEKKKDYNWLKKDEDAKAANIEKITNFKLGVTGQEKNLAAALQARANNPDLVYKDKNQQIQETYGNDVRSGLIAIEAEEKKEIAKYIKATEGKDINIGAISDAYEEDGAYDVTANKVYTVGDYNYRLRSDDGKTIIMEKKKVGTKDSWQQVSAKEAEQANGKANAKTVKEQKAEFDKKVMDSSTMPKAMQAAAKFTEDDTRYDWINTNNLEDRQYMLRVTANKISSDAGSMSEENFKKKYGFTIQEWKKSSDDQKRWDLILES